MKFPPMIRPDKAYINYTRWFDKQVGASRMAKDAAWAVRHPVARMQNKGPFNVPEQMMIPAGPVGGGFRPKLFNNNKALASLVRDTRQRLNGEIQIKTKKGSSWHVDRPSASEQQGRIMERLRALHNSGAKPPMENMHNWHVQDYADALGMDVMDMTVQEARDVKLAHLKEMLRQPHMDNTGKGFTPSLKRSKKGKYTDRGGEAIPHKSPYGFPDKPIVAHSRDEGLGGMTDFYHNALQNQARGRVANKHTQAAARAMLVQDLLKRGSGMYRSHR